MSNNERNGMRFQHKIALQELVVLFVTLFLIAAAPQRAIAQSNAPMRVITFNRPLLADPIQFGNVYCAGQKVTSGVPFEDPANDWLDGCTVEIKNRIAKTLITTNMAAFAPESGSGKPGEHDPIAAFMIGVGKSPSWKLKDQPNATNNGTPIAVASGQSTTVSLSRIAAGLQEAADRKGKPGRGISQVILVLETTDFSDGTEWLSGNFFKPDIQAGHGYVRIDRDEFYRGIELPQRN
jgi:hypothetical protein